MRTADAGAFLRPQAVRQIAVRLVIVLVLALAAPAVAAAHGSHPSSESSLSDSASHESGGGTSGLLVGGVIAGMIALVGGLLYVKARQDGPATGTTSAGAVGAAREAKRRARSSW